MTEAEWLAATNPMPMLAFLEGKASDRKLRLFACACVRRVWEFLDDEISTTVVEVAERYADGRATLSALKDVYNTGRLLIDNWDLNQPGFGDWYPFIAA